MDSSLVPILKKIPLFADLSEEQNQTIIQNITLSTFPTGHVFFKEGEAPDGNMYILKHGIVKITRKDPVLGTEREIASLTDNDFFGEMALILNESRNATVIAIADTEAFQIKKDDYIKLIESSPVMASKVSNEFVARLKQNSKFT